MIWIASAVIQKCNICASGKIGAFLERAVRQGGHTLRIYFCRPCGRGTIPVAALRDRFRPLAAYSGKSGDTRREYHATFFPNGPILDGNLSQANRLSLRRPESR
jgi:hypothetical protein